MAVILFRGPCQPKQNRQGHFTASVTQDAAQRAGDTGQFNQGSQSRHATTATFGTQRTTVLSGTRLARGAGAGQAAAPRAILGRSAKRRDERRRTTEVPVTHCTGVSAAAGAAGVGTAAVCAACAFNSSVMRTQTSRR